MLLLYFVLFVRSRTLARGMVLPVFTVSVLTSVRAP